MGDISVTMDVSRDTFCYHRRQGSSCHFDTWVDRRTVAGCPPHMNASVIYRHACIHICIHPCIHVYLHTSVHTQMHACIHRYIHTQFAHACRQTHECVCVHAFRSQHRASCTEGARCGPEGRPPLHACMRVSGSQRTRIYSGLQRTDVCMYTHTGKGPLCMRQKVPSVAGVLATCVGACEAHTGGGEKHCHDQCHLSPAPPHRRVHHHLWQCPAPRPHRPASLALCSVRG